MRRAINFRQRPAGWIGINPDHRHSARQRRRHHRMEADATGAEHRDRIACADLQHVVHGAHAGWRGAAEQNGNVHRQVAGHRGEAVLAHHRLTLKRGHTPFALTLRPSQS